MSLGAFRSGILGAAGAVSFSEEYVLVGPATGTITVPGAVTNIQVSGIGPSGDGGAGQGQGGGGGGGGGVTNLIGDPYPSAGVTSLYYDLKASGGGTDSLIRTNGPAGPILVTFAGGDDGGAPGGGDPTPAPPGGTAGTGAPATGAGPNAIQGYDGGAGGARDFGGPASTAPGSGNYYATGGGGGGGGGDDPGPAGSNGGVGVAGRLNSPIPSLMTTLGIGPGPGTWAYGPSASGPNAGGTAGVAGTSAAHATGGTVNGPGDYVGGGGGAGGGILITDPGDPVIDGKYFGGGGGGSGASFTATPATPGSQAFVVIQITS